jgi:hypothetical protein
LDSLAGALKQSARLVAPAAGAVVGALARDAERLAERVRSAIARERRREE